jgi:hypothetical protein
MNGIIILIAKSNGNRLLKRKVRKLAREAQVDADVLCRFRIQSWLSHVVLNSRINA